MKYIYGYKRVAVLPGEQPPQMTCVVTQQIDAGKLRAEPAREQVDGQRKAIHLGEQRHDEGRVGTEAAPVAQVRGLEEAVGEPDEDDAVDDHQAPEAIVIAGAVHHRSSVAVHASDHRGDRGA